MEGGMSIVVQNRAYGRWGCMEGLLQY